MICINLGSEGDRYQLMGTLTNVVYKLAISIIEKRVQIYAFNFWPLNSVIYSIYNFMGIVAYKMAWIISFCYKMEEVAERSSLTYHVCSLV